MERLPEETEHEATTEQDKPTELVEQIEETKNDEDENKPDEDEEKPKPVEARPPTKVNYCEGMFCFNFLN